MKTHTSSSWFPLLLWWVTVQTEVLSTTSLHAECCALQNQLTRPQSSLNSSAPPLQVQRRISSAWPLTLTLFLLCADNKDTSIPPPTCCAQVCPDPVPPPLCSSFQRFSPAVGVCQGSDTDAAQSNSTLVRFGVCVCLYEYSCLLGHFCLLLFFMWICHHILKAQCPSLNKL